MYISDSRFRKALNIRLYETFLQLLAKKKHLNFDEMKYKMVTCGPPESKKTTVIKYIQYFLYCNNLKKIKKKMPSIIVIF